MSNPYDEMRAMSVGTICRTLAGQTVIFLLGGVILWWAAGRELAEFVTVDLRQIVLGLGLGLGLIAFAASFFALFPNLSEKLTRQQASNFAFLEKPISLPVIIFMSLCAGIGEEAFFRAGLQTFLGEYVHPALAIGLASIAFMLIHFAKPLIAAIIFVIGVVFGVFYWWSGSLLAVMLAHALYDVYAFWYLKKELHRLDLFAPSQSAEDAEAE